MARCEECIHSRVCVIRGFPSAFENTHWEKEPCDHFKAADVAPRAEVDELIYKLECLLGHATGGRLSKHTYDLRTMETVVTDYINKSYSDGMAEVARKIFEEIEDDCLAYPIQDGHLTILVDARCYNKLKKKYTDAEPPKGE